MTQVINALLRCECDAAELLPFEYIPEAKLWIFELDAPLDGPVAMGLNRIKELLLEHRETLCDIRQKASRIVLHISLVPDLESASATIQFDSDLLILIGEIGIDLEIQIVSEA